MAAISAGETTTRPLHVVLQQPAQPPLLIRTLLGIATALAVYIGLCVAWLVGSTLVRRHSNGLSLSTQLTSSAKASPSASNAYAPKEYSKVRDDDLYRLCWRV